MSSLKQETKIGKSHAGVSAALQLTRGSRARIGTCVFSFSPFLPMDSSPTLQSQASSPLPAYSPGLPSQSLGPLTPPPTPPHVPTMLSRTTSHPANVGRRPPKTPSSPSFDARTASAMCRRIDGYVSFANVEGLGSPPEDDIESVEAGRHHAWLKWLGLKQAAGAEGVARA